MMGTRRGSGSYVMPHSASEMGQRQPGSTEKAAATRKYIIVRIKDGIILAGCKGLHQANRLAAAMTPAGAEGYLEVRHG
jgi:hypothetical protein